MKIYSRIDVSFVSLEIWCIHMDMEITSRHMEIITGSMLGDGSMTKVYGKRNSAFRVGHADKQCDYVSWKFEQLQPFSVSLKHDFRRAIVGFDHAEGRPIMGNEKTEGFWVMRTVSHSSFRDIERKWYLRNRDGNYVLKSNRRIKVVPQDIKLTPLSVAVWFFDDGSNLYNHQSKYKCRNAVFHTLSFRREECYMLAEQLKELNLKDCKVRKRKSGFEIVICAGSFVELMNILEVNLPCLCMEYKVTKAKEYLPPGRRGGCKLNLDLVKELIQLHQEGKRQVDLANQFKVSKATVNNIVHGRSWK